MSIINQNLLKLIQIRLFSSVGYKSAISLDKLYPNSSLKLTTPSQPQPKEDEKFTGFIPINELDITYSRSSGPGGQNVNKVNTKVDIKLNIQSATWIHDEIKPKLIEKYKNRLTNDGSLIFRSDLTRFQHLNLADCLEKIRTAIRQCTVQTQPPTEETIERIRRRHERANRERLSLKRERGQVKNERQAPQF